MAFKDHPENSPAGKAAKEQAKASDSTASDVEKVLEKEAEQGFRGVEVDPTPNENYTVTGVTSGAPTPETDKAHAKDVREQLLDVDSKVDGVGRNN